MKCPSCVVLVEISDDTPSPLFSSPMPWWWEPCVFVYIGILSLTQARKSFWAKKVFFQAPNILVDVFSNISISPTLNRKQCQRVKCLYFCLKKKHSSVVFPAKRADLQFTNLNWPFKATWKFHWWALVEYVLCSMLEQCKFLYFRLNSRAWTLVLEKKRITYFEASNHIPSRSRQQLLLVKLG